MKAMGWCTRCRKVKPVRVTHYGKKLLMGICDGCVRVRRQK